MASAGVTIVAAILAVIRVLSVAVAQQPAIKIAANQIVTAAPSQPGVESNRGTIATLPLIACATSTGKS